MFVATAFEEPAQPQLNEIIQYQFLGIRLACSLLEKTNSVVSKFTFNSLDKQQLT